MAKDRNFPEKPFFSWMGWGMLQTCPQRWFLYNFGRELPGELGRDISIERKLSFWQAFAGQLADDGITEAIRHFKKERQWRTDLDDWLKETAMEYIRESKSYRDAALEGSQMPTLTRQVLDRYFFDEVPDSAEHRAVLETARLAVRRFFETDIPQRIEDAQPEWLMCEHKSGEFPWTIIDEVPVYAVYDFAIKSPETITIFDWKTGKVTPLKEQYTLRQLHWYALYAMTAWGVDPENIRLVPVFLGANFGYHETIPDPAILQEIRDEWREKHREIKAHMAADSRVEDLRERFPMTENLNHCVDCVFRTCEGYARIHQGNLVNPVKFAIPGEIA